jgi:hypothetical protein
MPPGFVVFAVGTGVVVIVVAVVVLLVTVSMQGRQVRGAQRRGEARRDLDQAQERAARAEQERDTGGESGEDLDPAPQMDGRSRDDRVLACRSSSRAAPAASPGLRRARRRRDVAATNSSSLSGPGAGSIRAQPPPSSERWRSSASLSPAAVVCADSVPVDHDAVTRRPSALAREAILTPHPASAGAAPAGTTERLRGSRSSAASRSLLCGVRLRPRAT